MRLLRSTLVLLLILISIISCQQSQEYHDAIVIGGGLMGSATAWQLARKDQKVILIEKQDSIFTSGSSFGTARIARSNNRGNDIWSYLHNNSVSEVKDLINFLNIEIPAGNYKMSDIYTTSPVSYLGRLSILEKLMSSLKRQKVDYKIATNFQDGKSLFDVTLPDSVLLQREYNEHSGTINPHNLIRNLHTAIGLKGGTITFGHEILSIAAKQNTFELSVKDLTTGSVKILKTKRVVAAAGPYTGILLKDIAPYFDDLINPQRVFLAFSKIKKETYQSLSKENIQKLNKGYPVINSSKGTRDGSFFSMIEYYDNDGIPVIKVGGHFQRSDIDNLDEVWSKELQDSELQLATDNTREYLKILNLPLEDDDLVYDHSYSCVYSLTKTEVPLVTPVIGDDEYPNNNFVVLGGMSGVGAKGAMTYGKIASDIMLGIRSDDEMYNIVKDALGYERLRE